MSLSDRGHTSYMGQGDRRDIGSVAYFVVSFLCLLLSLGGLIWAPLRVDPLLPLPEPFGGFGLDGGGDPGSSSFG